jgi:nucleoside-triphosphatase THEP1
MQHCIIISGPINSGKTTYLHRLIAYYERKGASVGGVTAEARYASGRKSGYDICDIASGQQTALVRSNSGSTPPPDGAAQAVGRFILLDSGLEFSRKVLEAGLGCEVLCLDEIGPLEMRGRGHMPALKLILGKYRGLLLLVARESVVEELSDLSKAQGWEVEIRTSGFAF